MADLEITDEELECAGALLASASSTMVENDEATPSGNLDSLTNIGAEVRRFLTGLQTGRMALADAAKTAGAEVAEVMRDSSELDASLAKTVYAGFAVQGSGK